MEINVKLALGSSTNPLVMLYRPFQKTVENLLLNQNSLTLKMETFSQLALTPKEKGKVAKFIGKKCIVLCKLNGVEIPVLLDTGAQVSIISLQVLKHCSPETTLNKIEDCLDSGATLELTTANGTVLPYLGWVSINCELKGDNKGSGTISLPMLVTESILDHPIIGYHVLEQLISTCDTNSKTDEIIFALSGSLPNVRGENLCCLVESIRSGNDPYLCHVTAGKRNVIIPAG